MCHGVHKPKDCSKYKPRERSRQTAYSRKEKHKKVDYDDKN